METTLLFADERMALASCGNVFINVLRKPLSLEGLAKLRELSIHMFKLYDGKYGSLALLEPGSAMDTPPDVREASKKFANEFAILGAAIAIEGHGFRPATTRTLIAGIYLLKKPPYPHKICSSANEGAAWLVHRVPGSPTPNELVAAAETTRNAIK